MKPLCPKIVLRHGGLGKYGCHTNRKTEGQFLYRDGDESAKARRVGLSKAAKPVPRWERSSDRRCGMAKTLQMVESELAMKRAVCIWVADVACDIDCSSNE